MVARIKTVAFSGIKVMEVDVQVQITSGLTAFSIVGLADKAVTEARERVRGALHAMGLSLPAKRITVNMAPADLSKEGSHFDLPIALALLAAMEVLPADQVDGCLAMGELSLDGRIASVTGVLPAALYANTREYLFICPATQGSEAAWAGENTILAAESLIALINHFRAQQLLPQPRAEVVQGPQGSSQNPSMGLEDIKGQESAKRALEIAASGGHNLLMCGPPGAGKSMLAKRMAGLLPPLEREEVLEVSMVHSLSGTLPEGGLMTTRPFRDPHHSASIAALSGGGARAKPGEVSLAHLGVLFLDELPEFQRQALESLRQPMENGTVSVARANAHVTYPARFQLVAAMNPCRCGYSDDPARACGRVPKCVRDYQAKISGPLLDRIDLHVSVAPVPPLDLTISAPSETSQTVAARVARTRTVQSDRYHAMEGESMPRTNAEADGVLLERVAAPDESGRALLSQAAEQVGFSARGYHRVLRVARTLADMEGVQSVKRIHIAEALSYRYADRHG